MNLFRLPVVAALVLVAAGCANSGAVITSAVVKPSEARGATAFEAAVVGTIHRQQEQVQQRIGCLCATRQSASVEQPHLEALAHQPPGRIREGARD